MKRATGEELVVMCLGLDKSARATFINVIPEL
jgi:hypothetical protein